MTVEDKKEYPLIDEFVDQEWYPAWYGNIQVRPNKWGTIDAVWGFALADKLKEDPETRKYANFWNTAVNLPNPRKITKFYLHDKKGNPSKLKKVLDAFGVEDEIMKKLGGTTLEIEPIRTALKDILKGKMVSIKLAVKPVGEKIYYNVLDVRAHVEVPIAAAVPKKAPAKIGKGK